MIGREILICLFLLAGCSTWHAPNDLLYTPIRAGDYEIATWQRQTSQSAPIHIYIEGDGRSFYSSGMPSADPTPRGTFMRDLAAADNSLNVIYMARPCQYVMSPVCTVSDWTDGRFSPRIIDAMAAAVKSVSGSRPIILIGYSGGAMVSGLIIKNYPQMNIEKWITVAGVLNHADWTSYFDDSPLSSSLDMDELPRLPQVHYAAQNDKVLPIELTQHAAGDKTIILVPDATHDNFGNLELDFSY